jgi:hypothetical protein
VIHDKITPYIVGIEPDSVLIDITDIRDLNELKSFLASHNTEAEFHFFGGLLLEHKYLNRRFIETKWDTTSPHYKKLISEGLKADDRTIIKGFPSLPADQQIVRVTVERLLLIHPVQLRKKMFERFAHFGQVLDVGLDLDHEFFYGRGYAVINISEPNMDEPETLRRVINWFNEDRELLLTWSEMPKYCRFCQKSDHCRADCPDLYKSKQCYNCNELGHVNKDCPRRNHGSNPLPTRE